MVRSEARRFNVLSCGRRWGKTTFGIDTAAHPALAGFPVAWFGPTYKNIADTWRQLVQVLRPVTVRKLETEHRLELITGGTIEMWSLDKDDVARGRKYRMVVVDEAAMVANLKDAWQFVIRPTLTDYQGSAWFMSTPRGMNYFKVLFDRGQDTLRPTWASWQMPTVSNPHIAPGEIQEARQDMHELAFNQEYLAQFVSFEGAVFRRVMDAAVMTPATGPVDGREYVFVPKTLLIWPSSVAGSILLRCRKERCKRPDAAVLLRRDRRPYRTTCPCFRSNLPNALPR
jgi:hypothetical protein